MERQSMDDARGPLASVASQLHRLRARAAALLFLAGVASLLAAALATALTWGLLDYLVRMPAWLRMAGLAGGAAAAVVGVRRWVLPAIRFRPSLTEVALRVERSERGRAAGLKGVLASGLELSGQQEVATTRWMAERVVDEARRRFAAAGSLTGAVLNPVRARHSLLTLAVCVSAAVGIAAVAGRSMIGVGAARVLAPWAGAQWPKRTAVVDATDLQVHPIGAALALRAALTRTDQAMGQTRVTARFRILDGGVAGPVRPVLLTGQGKPVAVDTEEGALTGHGELYERLVEPGALAARAAPDAPPAELEYWFETVDDRTEPRRIKLVPPPAVVGASAAVTPPAYSTGGESGVARAFVSGVSDLGVGNDQRSVVGPVLAGSKVQLTVRLNKPVRIEDEASGAERAAFLANLFPGADLGPDPEVRLAGAVWTIAWTASSSVRLPIAPRDEYGLVPVDPASFAFDVVTDRPPTATVTLPREDEAVLATAVVQTTGEARDDVGLSDLRLQAQHARPVAGSIGAGPDPLGDPATVAIPDRPGAELGGSGAGGGEGAVTLPASPLQAEVHTTLDLATLDVVPGDEVWLTALATDNFALGQARHDSVRSSARKLRIIKEEELIEQVRAELSAIRKISIRLDQEQADLRTAAASGSVTVEDQRRQAALTQRIAQQGEAAQRLGERIERNRLDDEALTGLLTDVGTLLQGAGKDSEQAAAKLEQAAAQTPEHERTGLTPEQARDVGESQDAVRDQLGRLAEMLDRGEDSWLVGRNLQRMLQQQRDLMARTTRAGESTMGKKAQDLTAQERAELQQIAEQQQRLADQARQAIDQLDQRGKQMEKVDAAQSQGMKQAAQRGREQEVPEKMSKASQSAQQNQTSSAQEQQQQAMDAMEQMLQDLNDAPKKRDEALRRVLADLLQSLDRLIREQDAQVEALAKGVEDGALTGLDRGMIELNKNTLDVAEKARADRQMTRIAQIIDKAGNSQVAAIGALRAAPADPEKAGDSERESARLLRLARAEAQKLQEEAAKRDEDRKRQELRRVYRERLEQQVALKGETDPLVGKPIDRRDRMKVRGLGERQETLRVDLDTLKQKTQELADAGVFDLAHQRLDQSTGLAAKKLRTAIADRATQRAQDSAVHILKSLVEALDDRAKEDDEFREEDSGGGGGGGGGGQKPPLIPPLAELRLLRALQQEAADLTRGIDESRDSAPEELSGVGQLQRSLNERGKELIKKLQPPRPTTPEPDGKEKP